MSDLQIRLATPADLDEIMKIAVTACEENGFLHASAEMLAKEIWPALCQQGGLCPVIGPPGGPIEGVALLRVGSMWYSPEKVLEERVIFVHPKFRAASGGRARRLCEFSKRAAESLGLPLIIGVLSNTRTEAKVRMYKKIFGEPSGAFFLYGARAEPGHKVAS